MADGLQTIDNTVLLNEFSLEDVKKLYQINAMNYKEYKSFEEDLKLFQINVLGEGA